jgi:hypothetical protein
MWPYILTTIAVAAFPLALAGYGGHLATLALPERSKKKRMAWLLCGGWLLGCLDIRSFSSGRLQIRQD